MVKQSGLVDQVQHWTLCDTTCVNLVDRTQSSRIESFDEILLEWFYFVTKFSYNKQL